MNLAAHALARLALPALLLAAAPAFADVWWRDGTLEVSAPAGYRSGSPILVRIDLLDAAGRTRRDVWNATATLSASGGVALSSSRVALFNGRGSALVTLTGTNACTLEARIGRLAGSRALSSLSAVPVVTAAGTLTATNTVWSNVVHVTGDVLIPAGRTLTVLPGTLVLLDGVASGTAGTDIDVEGALRSLGTAQAPVTFTCWDPALRWGEFHHANAATSLYTHTVVTLGGRSPGVGHTGSGPVFRVSGSALTLDHCSVADLGGKTMYASAGSSVVLRECLCSRSVMGPEVTGTALLAERTWFTEMIGPDDDDCIYLHTQNAGQTLTLSGCVMADADDDCIDMLHATATVENCIVRDAFDKGISTYGGRVTILGSLVTAGDIGVASKEDAGGTARVSIGHTTIAGNRTIGLYAYDKFNATNALVYFWVTNSIIEAEGGPADPVVTDYDPANIVIRHSDVGEAWPGAGNRQADPRFLLAADRNYRLTANSPCVDAGTNAVWSGTGADLDGAVRPLGAAPDMGAFERGALACAFTGAPLAGRAPLATVFTGVADGTNTTGLGFAWDFDGDGVVDRAGPAAVVTNTYAAEGAYDVTLVVTNAAGESAGALRQGYVVASDLHDVAYVSPAGSNVAPYATWATAARAPQSAVDAVASNGLVLVTNGVYVLAAPLVLSRPVTVRGVNGAGAAVLDGGGAVRCAELRHAGALLEGLTLRNGRALSGGGVYLTAGTVRQCVVRGNLATGGGSASDGGGVEFSGGGTVDRCVLRNNQSADDGAGAFFGAGGTIQNSLIVSNAAGDKGGGAYVRDAGRMEQCTVVTNSAAATPSSGGIYANAGGVFRNCIFYYNKAQNVANTGTGQTYAYCCSATVLAGTGNTTNAPRFVARSAGDFRLQPGSACIDAGTAIAGLGTDLDGTPRPLDGNADGAAAADMGAYEFASPDADTDADGASDAGELVAGTDPASAASVLTIRDAAWDAMGGDGWLSWSGRAARLYSLYSTLNLTGGWSVVPGFADLPGTDGRMVITNVVPAARATYFRLGVERSP